MRKGRLEAFSDEVIAFLWLIPDRRNLVLKIYQLSCLG
jgi:hypothetical protein